MKISQKGLYALQAMMTLARRHEQGAIKIRDIAAESHLPEKFLELILLELKNARMVDSVRGAKDADHRALYQVFLAVRDAAAKILENTTIADLVGAGSGKGKKGKSVKSTGGPAKRKAPKA